MGLLERVAVARRGEVRYSADQWLTDYLLPAIGQFGYGGNMYPFGLNMTAGGQKIAEIQQTLPGYAAALQSCPPAFAAQMVRALVLSQARFVFRSRREGTTRKVFGNRDLRMLERPWRNATTGELIARMEWDAGLAGNAFVYRQADRLRVLRPDWTAILYGSHQEPEDAAFALDGEVIGYVYCNGGLSVAGAGIAGLGNKPQTLLPDEVAHWSPLPDPLGSGIGMSWITPAVRDMQSDNAATDHKLQFWKRGATPNLVVKGIPATTQQQFDELVAMMESRHAGVANAYRTLYLTAGADAEVVGSNFRDMDLKNIQGASEPLALDTPIPTPTGWSTMGVLAVGDQVIGRDGQPANVVGVSPVHVGRECFRITLKDRTSIVADASHLWIAADRGSAKRAEKTYTTRELYDLFVKGYPNGAGGYRIALPAAPIVELPAADLLVDPYVLGAWLGDGQTAGAAICGATDDLKFIASEIESRGYVTTQWSTAPDKVDVIGMPGGLLAALRVLGVLGNKRIPDQYLRASVTQRLDLLRGLMDTDGCVDKGKAGCSFSSKDYVLARQVAELVRSLGYRATLSRFVDERSRSGEMCRVGFRAALDRLPFLLPRKADRCIEAGGPYYSDSRSVVSIEPVDSVPVRCISVDTEDHLFLAGEGFVPTHNTRIAFLSRVPAPLLGIAEGLGGSSLNAGNFAMARRIFADSWVYPTLQDLSSALAPIVKVPGDAELWTDTSDMPILREDAHDAAEIEDIKATTITKYVREGFTADSAIAAVRAQDIGLLKHSGLTSVQLQPPMPNGPPGIPGAPGAQDPFAAPGSDPFAIAGGQAPAEIGSALR